MWFLAFFSIHLIVYTLIRVGFLVWNWQGLRTLGALDLLRAFGHGLRFDLSVLAATAGLCLLGLVWIKKPAFVRAWAGLFIALNAALIVLNFGDMELFNFTAKRFSVASFYLLGEGSTGNLLWPYIPLASACFLTVLLYVYFTVKLMKSYSFNFTLKQKALLSILILALGVVFSRGGFQLKPMSYVDAKIFDSSYANNLVLNSSFTLLKSIGKSSLERNHHFSESEMLSLLNPQNLPETEGIPEVKKLNVVIVILEGFSAEYLALKNPEASPFLNRLRVQGADFSRAYANGRRSVEGVAAVLLGIPALMEEPFIDSQFSANQVIGLGTLLQQKNYHTSFFHGARNGSMHFDAFTKSMGIENYYGLNEYPEPKDNDGTWGIFDEPFLQWACQKYGEFTPPFFSTIFTLSSHQPFNLPEKYRAQFRDARNPMLKSVRYTDYALERFMACAEKQPWYKDTLFIFTGDHTGPALDEASDFESRYKIALLMYSPVPGLLDRVETKQYAQQIDILPTLLDFLHLEYKNKNYLSRSLLRPGPKVIALYADRQYKLVGDVTDGEKQLQAVQQYFSEGLYDNRLYYPVK